MKSSVLYIVEPLINKDIDINYISKRLGYATTNENLSTYAHVLDKFKQKQDSKVIETLKDFDFL
ncbi:hypothetical protein OZ415_04500 [Aerococcus urinaeequi]|uniref:Uncharacterized protein n=1 Tax=Aerococcus urinaeequi TaxID=51665 RepID=A0AA47J0U9_9LACT|nr:hypothetical protein [Aerococcus urinaeequi]WAT25329.1 hypothetical protein OZ415_04500 [Aerococcus urinaeequi]